MLSYLVGATLLLFIVLVALLWLKNNKIKRQDLMIEKLKELELVLENEIKDVKKAKKIKRDNATIDGTAVDKLLETKKYFRD